MKPHLLGVALLAILCPATAAAPPERLAPFFRPPAELAARHGRNLPGPRGVQNGDHARQGRVHR